MTVQPRLASAVMLLRDAPSGQGIEVFMVRRVIQSDFMPDVYVFPGGSVSKDDRAAEQTYGICAPVLSPAADPEGRTALGTGTRAAAIRELFEEAGILLAYRALGTDPPGQRASPLAWPHPPAPSPSQIERGRDEVTRWAGRSQGEGILAMGEDEAAHFDAYRRAFHNRTGSLVTMAQTEHLVLASDCLNYYAHWITPEGMPKRFDTHFFLAIAPAEQEAAHDRLETSEGIWIAPSEALARFERKEFPLVFATIHQLRDLAVFSSVQEALESTAKQHVPTHVPVLVHEDGKTHVYLPEDKEHPWEVPEHMTRM